MFFNPSCGLCLYKPKLTERVYEKLHGIDPSLKPHGICCRRNPESCLRARSSLMSVLPATITGGPVMRASAPYLCMNTLIVWTPFFAAL